MSRQRSPTSANAALTTRSAFPWFESYQVASASLYDQVWMTGWRFTSSMPAIMRCLSSCFEVTRMWRKTDRANLEKKPSMRLSQEPCLGVKVNSKRPGRYDPVIEEEANWLGPALLVSEEAANHVAPHEPSTPQGIRRLRGKRGSDANEAQCDGCADSAAPRKDFF